MKIIKISLFLLISLLIVSCGNKNKKDQINSEEKKVYLEGYVKVQMDSLLSGFESIEFLSEVKLTRTQKLLKPQYLYSPKHQKDLLTLSQKYKAVVVYSIDREVAKLFGMGVGDYDIAIQKLLLDLGSISLEKYVSGEIDDDLTFYQEFYQESLENERMDIFWEVFSASLLETLYITSKNLNTFTPYYTDASIASLTNRLQSLNIALRALIPYHEEMNSLFKVINPLYSLNAKTVLDFRRQVKNLNSQISLSRNYLLK